MTYRVEDIIRYLPEHSGKYCFEIREYASINGEYTNEAVVFSTLVSDIVGIIFDDMPINPTIYYTKGEMLALLDKLEEKGQRVHKLIKKASTDFKKNVRVGNIKKESKA